jgi:hypothetical protein
LRGSDRRIEPNQIDRAWPVGRATHPRHSTRRARRSKPRRSLCEIGVLRYKAGVAYYNHHLAFSHPVRNFHRRAVLSIYPPRLRWRYDIRAGSGQRLAPAQFKKMQMIVRVEMTLLLLAPFFATWMAHGDF